MDKEKLKKWSWLLPVAAVILIVIFWFALGRGKKSEEEPSTVSVVQATEAATEAMTGNGQSQTELVTESQTAEDGQPASNGKTEVATEGKTTANGKTEVASGNQTTENAGKKKNGKKNETETSEAKAAEGKTEAETSELRFRKESLLEQHYEKHGIEMGFDNEEDYQAAAIAVVNNPDSLHKTEKEDGDDVYFLEATGEFVVVSTDGYIRTYFIPSGGKAYFDRQ